MCLRSKESQRFCFCVFFCVFCKTFFIKIVFFVIFLSSFKRRAHTEHV